MDIQYLHVIVEQMAFSPKEISLGGTVKGRRVSEGDGVLVAPLKSPIVFGVLDLHMVMWPRLVSMHVIMLLCTHNKYPGDSTAAAQPQA